MAAPTQSPAAVPWHFFATHRRCPFAFFIDRAADPRLSFAGSRPREQLVIDADGLASTWCEGTWHRAGGDPLDHIAAFVERSRARPAALPAWLDGETLPRTVGFLAYELRHWTDAPAQRRRGCTRAARDAVGTPLAVLSTYDEVDVWDSRSGRSVRVRLAPATRHADPPALPAPAPAAWTATTREAYRRGFEHIREAIAAGEIYQANLSRRAVFDHEEDAADAYARLREVQPVPWGAFLDFGGFALLSNSPECFLERHGDVVVTRPIKGTRGRGGDTPSDAAERAALRSDPKEMAEHLMIVDLERNDLGRVARTGSVEVTWLATVESFATVHHMVSEVRALLREGTSLGALLRATFPGGSITGAPKLRAMEILAEVEATERGPYTGAVGFFNGADEIEMSIAIRTAVASNGRVLYSTGGGIVADSDPDREWDETELKLAALRTALAAAPRRAKSSPAGQCKAGVNR